MAIGEETKKTNDYSTDDPSLSGTEDYDSIASMCIYQFLSDAYEGSGGFRNGRCLIPHATETKMFYQRRQELAYYKNYVQPIIRATIDPVFNSEIKRSVKVNGEEAGKGNIPFDFTQNATGSGMSLQSFVDHACTLSALHMVSFVIMDNVTKEVLSEVQEKKTAIKQRLYPYVFMRTMEELESSKQNNMGALEWIRFCDGEESAMSAEGVAYHKKFYVYYDASVIRKEYKNEKGVIVLESEVLHELGAIPVVPVYYEYRKSKNKKRIELDPPFYDIARINHAIFNKDSLITSSERSQGFCIFFMQEDKPGAVTIGRFNYLSLPMGTTIPPGYAAPPPEVLNMLVGNNEKLREDLFRIAGQKGVDFRSTQAKSGDALEWEFIAQEVVLGKTAARASALEYAIMELFKLYSKESFDFSVEYPDKYRPDSEENELADLDKLLLMIEDKPKTRNYIQKQAFMVKAKRWPEDEVVPLLEEFEYVPAESDDTDNTNKDETLDENGNLIPPAGSGENGK